MIVSISPGDGDNVSRSQNPVIVFTEPIDQGGASVSFDPVVLETSLVWNGFGNSVTVDHEEDFAVGPLTLTVDFAPDEAGNALAGALDGIAHPATLTVRKAGSSNAIVSKPSAILNFSIVSQSSGLEILELTPGSDVTLHWETTGNIPNVNVSYAMNGMTSITVIDMPTINDYVNWTVPSGFAGNAVFSLTCTDLAITCGTLVSRSYPFVTEPIETEISTEPLTIDPTVRPLLGRFVKAPSFPTVYYVTNEAARRPFIDAQTYFTWADSFDEIVVVGDADLALMSIDGIMLPNPGTVLVKFESDVRVFAVEAEGGDARSPVLRWIPDETTARALYGDAWSDYVVDISPTFYARFRMGSAMALSEVVDASTLLSRETVARAIASGNKGP